MSAPEPLPAPAPAPTPSPTLSPRSRRPASAEASGHSPVVSATPTPSRGQGVPPSPRMADRPPLSPRAGQTTPAARAAAERAKKAASDDGNSSGAERASAEDATAATQEVRRSADATDTVTEGTRRAPHVQLRTRAEPESPKREPVAAADGAAESGKPAENPPDSTPSPVAKATLAQMRSSRISPVKQREEKALTTSEEAAKPPSAEGSDALARARALLAQHDSGSRSRSPSNNNNNTGTASVPARPSETADPSPATAATPSPAIDTKVSKTPTEGGEVTPAKPSTPRRAAGVVHTPSEPPAQSTSPAAPSLGVGAASDTAAAAAPATPTSSSVSSAPTWRRQSLADAAPASGADTTASGANQLRGRASPASSGGALLLSQKEADQMVAAAQKEHKQQLKERENEIKSARKDLEKAEKELAKTQAKLQETQAKLEAEKTSHAATKSEAKEKQNGLSKELKQAVKEAKDTASREQKLQKEVEKLTAAAAAAAAATAESTGSVTPYKSGGLATPRGFLSLNGSFASSTAAGGKDSAADAVSDDLRKKLAALEKENAKLSTDLARAVERAAKAEEKSGDAEAARRAMEKDIAQLRKDVAEAEKLAAVKEKAREALQKDLERQKVAMESMRSSGARSPRQVTFMLPDETAAAPPTPTPALPVSQEQQEKEERLRQDLAAAQQKVATLEHTKSLLEKKNDTLQKLVDKLEKEAEQAVVSAQEELDREAENAKQLKQALQESELSANKLFDERESMRKELQQMQKNVDIQEAEITELNTVLSRVEGEREEARDAVAQLQQQLQQVKAKSPSPDREGKIKLLLDKLTEQETTFTEEREGLRQRIRDLEDAVCDVQNLADDRADEARTLAISLEESERGREHVLSVYTAKAADLQAELAQLQAKYEHDVGEAATKARDEASAEVDRLQEELTVTMAQVTDLKQQLELAAAAATVTANNVHTLSDTIRAQERELAERESALTALQSDKHQLQATIEKLREDFVAMRAGAAEHDATREAMTRLQQQFQEETEKRKRLEAEVLTLKEAAEQQHEQYQQLQEEKQQLQEQYQQLQEEKQQLQQRQERLATLSPVGTALAAASFASGAFTSANHTSGFSLHDEHEARQSQRPSRARSPQEPRCLDTSCFDPTVGTPRHATPTAERPFEDKENRRLPHPSSFHSSPATPSASLSGAKKQQAQQPTTPQNPTSSMLRSPSQFQPRTDRLLNLDDYLQQHQPSTSNGHPTHGEGKRIHHGSSDRRPSSRPYPGQSSATPPAAESVAGYSVGPLSAASAAASAAHGGGVFSIAGPQPLPPLFACPASPPGLSFNMSAGRLLVSHHGRRLERLLFQPSTSPVSPSDIVSTAALASLSHRLHAARSHSSQFAFTVRLLDTSPNTTSGAGGLMVGFSDRFLPMEGFGQARSSLRYESCYYLNVKTGRLYCPGLTLLDRSSDDDDGHYQGRRHGSVARYVDVPYDGWIEASGKAAAARGTINGFNAFMNDGQYFSPSASFSVASASQPRMSGGSSSGALPGNSERGTDGWSSGACVAPGDEVTCCLDIDAGSISFMWNGVDCGPAVSGLDLSKVSLYPSVEVNEGGIALELL